MIDGGYFYGARTLLYKFQAGWPSRDYDTIDDLPEQVYFQKNEAKNPKITRVWLPTQEQLQDMLGEEFHVGKPIHLIKNFDKSCRVGRNRDNLIDDYWKQFECMNSLWLAFVMKHKYGKVWDNEQGEWGV